MGSIGRCTTGAPHECKAFGGRQSTSPRGCMRLFVQPEAAVLRVMKWLEYTGCRRAPVRQGAIPAHHVRSLAWARARGIVHA